MGPRAGEFVFRLRTACTASSLALLGLLPGYGCGGASAEPPPQTPTQVDARPRAERATASKPRMQMESDLGTVDRAKVDDAFSRLQTRLGDCMGQGSTRIEFLSGHLHFMIRIAANGSTRWVYLVDTTVGDRNTEKCMLDQVRAMQWPPPEQGEGQVEKEFDFDVAPGVRDAVAWESDRVSKSLKSARAKFARCTQSSRGKYKMTAYVASGGTVLAAGVAPPDERSEANVDCLVEVAKGLKLSDPGSWPAKVSFDLP